MTGRIKLKAFLLYLFYGLLINVCMFPIWFISIYTNAKTYHGFEGHNNGFVILIFTLPIWLLILNKQKKLKNENAVIAFGINAALNFVLLISIGISEMTR